MSKVIHIDENVPLTVSVVICVLCGCRWISGRPTTTQLKALECPDCTNQGYVIETGQVLEQEISSNSAT